MSKDEEEDPSFAEDFDDLNTDKDPIVLKDKSGQKRKRSLVGRVTHEMYKVFDEACKDINITTGVIPVSANTETSSKEIKDNFRTGNQLQLVSRSSGRTLQIVTSPNGQIVVDGNGAEGPQAANAVWTITDLKNNIVALHNNNNFLSIVSGTTSLRYYAATNQVGRESHFRVVQVQNNFVCLESIHEPGRHIGIQNTGQLKSAVATGREIDGQFGVRLIYSPYPPAADPQHAKAATYQAPPPAYPGYVVAPPGGAAAGAAGQTTVTQAPGVTVVQTTYPPAGPPPYRK